MCRERDRLVRNSFQMEMDIKLLQNANACIDYFDSKKIVLSLKGYRA